MSSRGTTLTLSLAKGKGRNRAICGCSSNLLGKRMCFRISIENGCEKRQPQIPPRYARSGWQTGWTAQIHPVTALAGVFSIVGSHPRVDVRCRVGGRDARMGRGACCRRKREERTQGDDPCQVRAEGRHEKECRHEVEYGKSEDEVRQEATPDDELDVAAYVDKKSRRRLRGVRLRAIP